MLLFTLDLDFGFEEIVISFQVSSAKAGHLSKTIFGRKFKADKELLLLSLSLSLF